MIRRPKVFLDCLRQEFSWISISSYLSSLKHWIFSVRLKYAATILISNFIIFHKMAALSQARRV